MEKRTDIVIFKGYPAQVGGLFNSRIQHENKYRDHYYKFGYGLAEWL